MESACFLADNGATATASELAQVHGAPISCEQVGRLVILGVNGGGSDTRPGFLGCAQPAASNEDYCGIGLSPDISSQVSHAANWQFLPSPVASAREIGDPARPQLYQCVGDASSIWTFHFDTLQYTTGCTVPPTRPYPDSERACDEFLYVGVHTTTDQFYELYDQYGKADACAVYGSTIVGVLDGKPVPTLVICDGGAQTLPEAERACGFEFALPGVPSTVWQTASLPVSAGPVTSATFDTATGAACVTAGAQSFEFVLKTLQFTAGCEP